MIILDARVVNVVVVCKNRNWLSLFDFNNISAVIHPTSPCFVSFYCTQYDYFVVFSNTHQIMLEMLGMMLTPSNLTPFGYSMWLVYIAFIANAASIANLVQPKSNKKVPFASDQSFSFLINTKSSLYQLIQAPIHQHNYI